MHQYIKHVLLTLCLIGIWAGPAGMEANAQDLPVRDQAYIRNLVSLSGVIGSAHAVRVVCNGTDDQYWRSYMQQLLGLEAPNRGSLRSSMVEAFNAGFEDDRRRRRGQCGPNAKSDEEAYASRGRALSEQLAAHYFPKRRR
ncbi:MAG: TIGR02301 family protein [Pseudomonadota bacterium]